DGAFNRARSLCAQRPDSHAATQKANKKSECNSRYISKTLQHEIFSKASVADTVGGSRPLSEAAAPQREVRRRADNCEEICDRNILKSWGEPGLRGAAKSDLAQQPVWAAHRANP